MRDILTALAGAVILILSAALAAPPFVDWAGQRELIERAIATSLGVPARTEGRIGVRLLPFPRLRLDRLQIGEASPEKPSLDARFVKAELALAPLLTGEFRFTQTRIGRAEMRLPVGEGEAVLLPAGLGEAMRNRDLVIEDLQVQRAILKTQVPGSGRTDRFRAEALRLKAPSLAGPWQAEGVSAGVPFRLASTAITDQGATVKLSGGGESQPRFEADARIVLKPLDPEIDARALDTMTVESGARALVPEAEGSARFVVGNPGKSGQAAMPFSLGGRFKARGGFVRFETVNLEVDPVGQAARLSGSGQINLRTWRAGLNLEARRLNLDGLLYSAAGQAMLGRGLPAKGALGGTVLPVMLDLDLKVESLALGFEDWSDLQLKGTFDRTGGLVLRRFSALAPGATRLDATGELDVAPAARFNGRLDVEAASSEGLGRYLRRLGLEGPAVAALDGRPVQAASDLTASRDEVALRNLRLALGEARVTGEGRYARGTGNAPNGGRGRLEANVAAQGIDIAELPPVGDLVSGLDSHDVSLTVQARDVRYGPAGAHSGNGAIAARIQSDGPSLVVDSLDIADLAGANARLKGRIAPDGAGRIAGRVTAPSAAPLLALLDRVWIPEARLLPGFLREGALDLDVSLEREAGEADTLRTTAKGRAADSTLDGSLLARAGRLSALDATLSAPRAGAWFGRDDVAGLRRPATLTLSARREPAEPGGAAPLSLTASGTIAGLDLSTERPILIGAESGPPESGTLRAKTADLSPFLPIAGAASVPGPLPAELTLALSRKGDAKSGDAHAELSGRVAGAEGSASLDRKPDGALSGQASLGTLSLPALAAVLVLPTDAKTDAKTDMETEGDAGWSGARFAAVPEHPRADLALRVGRLDLGRGLAAEGTAFSLALDRDTLAIKNLSARLAGGRIAGSATIARQGERTGAKTGGSATIAGDGELSDVAIQELAGGTPIRGRLSASLRYSGSGDSAAALIGNLGGSGEMRLTDLALPGADPGAIDRTLARALSEDDPLREGRLQTVLSEELAAAPLAAKGPVTTSATLVGGTLRSGALDLDLGPARWSGGFSLDLRSKRLDARGTLTAAAAPKGWTGGKPSLQLGFTGSLSAPQREIETGPLSNGLAALVLQRELEKIELFDADQTERLRRRARIEMDKARAAALKAAAEKAAAEKAAQEKAAQEKAAAEEAARAARQRAQQAAAEEAARQARDRREAEETARRARGEQERGPFSEGGPLDIRPPQQP